MVAQYSSAPSIHPSIHPSIQPARTYAKDTSGFPRSAPVRVRSSLKPSTFQSLIVLSEEVVASCLASGLSRHFRTCLPAPMAVLSRTSQRPWGWMHVGWRCLLYYLPHTANAANVGLGSQNQQNTHICLEIATAEI